MLLAETDITLSVNEIIGMVVILGGLFGSYLHLRVLIEHLRSELKSHKLECLQKTRIVKDLLNKLRKL
jgi:hypothetical protein